MNNIDKQDIIDNYLLNRMSETEQQDFEAEMTSDSQLKETVELQRLLLSKINQRAFISEIINETEQRINKANDADTTDSLAASKAAADKKSLTNKIKFRQTKLVIYSAAAIFLGVFFINNALQNSRMNNLYSTYYAAPEVDIMRGGDVRGVDLVEADLLQATVYLESDQPKRAREILLKLQTITNNAGYDEDIYWYLALTELKLHNKSKAKKYLEELVDSEHYGEKVNEILSKL